MYKRLVLHVPLERMPTFPSTPMLKRKAHLADQPGLQAADWPRMADAWGSCHGPESATEGDTWRRVWPN